MIFVKWGIVGSGSIKLVITDTRNGCKDSLTVLVAINSSPVEITGNKTVCALSKEDYLINPEIDVEYSWEITGGEIYNNTADTSVVILWGEPGTGVIQLIGNNTENGEIDTLIQNITINELPEVKILGPDELCEGFIENYTAINTDNLSFKWIVYNGMVVGSDSRETVMIEWGGISSADSLFILASVTLEQTSLITGCTNSKTKKVYISKNPSSEIFGDFLTCENDIEFYSTEYEDLAMLNEWYVSGGTIIGTSSDSTLQVEWGIEGTGSIKLVQTSSTNCVDSSTIDISINQIPDHPTIEQFSSKLVSSADEGNQWYSESELLIGETSKEFTPDTSGHYRVQVSDENGCTSEMSLPFFFDKIPGVKDFNISQKAFKVYPNPTTGVIHIYINEQNKIILLNPFVVKIRSLIGMTLLEEEINAASDLSFIKFDISSLPNGMYIVQINILDDIYNYKIIKE